MTFDEVLPALKVIFELDPDRAAQFGPICVNRDLNGRIRLVVSQEFEALPQARQWFHEVSEKIAGTLGKHAGDKDRIFLFENAIDNFVSSAPSCNMESFDNVFIIDRLASEGNWATISDEAAGAKRIVFFSIKGGVGRSTALAASAWALAQNGQKVLVLDLDLESPGLSSSLLPDKSRPKFGTADWLVEDLVDNGDAVFDDMHSISSLSHDGEIIVVPAHGSNPGEYISKLGRVWMPKVSAETGRENWSARLQRLVTKLEERWKPDVVLIDSRAGIDEIASACVTDLGANLVLLFALDGEQTWTGYNILFDFWNKNGVAATIRERLQIVGAMLPEEGRIDYFEGLSQNAYDLFTKNLYDEIPPDADSTGYWSFDLSDENAPHYPWGVRWNRGFSTVRSLHSRLEGTDPLEIELIFGKLVSGIGSILEESDLTF
jgi:CobQ/CobB/MinD/ParA nucleotide binding domain